MDNIEDSMVLDSMMGFHYSHSPKRPNSCMEAGEGCLLNLRLEDCRRQPPRQIFWAKSSEHHILISKTQIDRWISLRNVLWLYLVTTVIATLYKMWLGTFPLNGVLCEQFQNFAVFRDSFFDLIQYRDLYTDSEGIFKYSPTFALLMAPFSALPYWTGVVIWNLLNSLCLFLGIKNLPHLSDRTKSFILLYAVIELTTSLQNAQSNALITGLILCAFSQLERDKYAFSALFIALTGYLKIFGLIAFLLIIFYPAKRRFALWFAIWIILLFLSPLLVIDNDQLVRLYNSWLTLLKADHASSYGLSVLGWLKAWFGIHPNKHAVTITGFLFLCLPLMRIERHKEYLFRLCFLSSMLVWSVIFNHKAESPTFIIAVVGVAIWYFSSPKSLPKGIVIITVFIFTQLIQTDVFPQQIRRELMQAFTLKVFPCIVAWFYIMIDLFVKARSSEIVDERINQ
jgi:hypothetical protein